MRVIGGFLRSRRLIFPRSPKVRPMTDRMKETLFNILGDALKEQKVLDVFAGSGGLGLEAISRGCADVVFVDSDRSSCNIILRNLKALKVTAKARTLCLDAEKAIKRLENSGESFGVIFLDPPYNKGVMKKILPRIDQSVILQPLSQVIIHHAEQEDFPCTLSCLQVNRSEKIGQARLSFLSTKAARHA